MYNLNTPSLFIQDNNGLFKVLEGVMENHEKCPYCNGLGYIKNQTKFDFDEIYADYPKKGPGKKKGMKKLERTVKSEKHYSAIKQALENLKKLNREKQYYPNFDTFINNYEDYLEVEITQPEPLKKRYMPIITHPRYELSPEEKQQRKRDLGQLLVSITDNMTVESERDE